MYDILCLSEVSRQALVLEPGCRNLNLVTSYAENHTLDYKSCVLLLIPGKQYRYIGHHDIHVLGLSQRCLDIDRS